MNSPMAARGPGSRQHCGRHSVCLCVRTHMCAHSPVCVRTLCYVRVCMCAHAILCVYAYVCTLSCVYVCMCVCMLCYVHVCMCVHTVLCMHVCAHCPVCVYVCARHPVCVCTRVPAVLCGWGCGPFTEDPKPPLPHPKAVCVGATQGCLRHKPHAAAVTFSVTTAVRSVTGTAMATADVTTVTRPWRGPLPIPTAQTPSSPPGPGTCNEAEVTELGGDRCSSQVCVASSRPAPQPVLRTSQ